jgi:hypothetical protein
LIVDNIGNKGGGVLVDIPIYGSSKTDNLKVGDFSGTRKESKLSKSLQDIPVLINNTIIYNSATLSGGIFCYDFSPDVMNSIVWGNTSTLGGQIGGTQTATVTYSDVEGGFTGTGNIDCNPGFLDTTYFLLSDSSCCIDAGNPDPMYNDVEDPNNLGNPLWPALGSLTNDIGHCGGPNSLWAHLDPPVSVEDDEIDGGIPAEFTLLQNYPNPFNPTTKINYQIPELSFVTLKIYDILGSEIATLVNEEKPIGSYEFEFDATALPSGIYFYRLQAGSFVETKKMILIK